MLFLIYSYFIKNSIKWPKSAPGPLKRIVFWNTCFRLANCPNGATSLANSVRTMVSKAGTENNAKKGNCLTIQIHLSYRHFTIQVQLDARRRTKAHRTAQWTRKQMGHHWTTNRRQVTLILSRTDNSVKNHFYSLLRKALRKVNIALQQSFRTDIK